MNLLSPLGLGLLLLSLCFGSYKLPHSTLFGSETFYIEVTTFYGSVAGFILIIAGFLLNQKRRSESLLELGITIPLIIFALSDIPFRRFGFSQPNEYYLTLAITASIGSLLFFLFQKRVGSILLAITIAIAFYGFFSRIDGALLFTDDHPSFLYRLIQLKENFPYIPFYNPLWNAGVEAREFFPSGALSLFFLGLPFVYFGDLLQNYNYLITFILFIFCPASIYISARLLGISNLGSSIAAILGISSSLIFYRWAFGHGTMGFIIAIVVLPLVIATSTKLFSTDTVNKKIYAIGAYLSFSLMIFWSLSLFFIVPIFILALWAFPKFKPKLLIFTLVSVLLLTHLPWMITFAKASNIFSFVAISDDNPQVQNNEGTSRIRKIKHANDPFYETALKTLRDATGTANPIIIFLAIYGVYFLKPGINRRALTSTLLWLITIGALGFVIKPQLELERFLVAGLLLAAIPAGLCCEKIILNPKNLGAKIATVVLLAFVFYIPYWTYRLTTNETIEKYQTADKYVFELVDAISARRNFGRTMFAGFTLHELSHGHVAPLPALTNAPLLASRYQHDRWFYTDIIPKSYRDRKAAGVDEFLDLMNVGTIITHDQFWRDWYTKRHKKFRKITKIDRFTIFERVDYKGSYFHKGKGEIVAQTGSNVELKIKSSEVILKFTYLPFLEAPSCIVAPEVISPDITLVKLMDCPMDRTVKLGSISPWKRWKRLFS